MADADLQSTAPNAEAKPMEDTSAQRASQDPVYQKYLQTFAKHKARRRPKTDIQKTPTGTTITTTAPARPVASPSDNASPPSTASTGGEDVTVADAAATGENAEAKKTGPGEVELKFKTAFDVYDRDQALTYDEFNTVRNTQPQLLQKLGLLGAAGAAAEAIEAQEREAEEATEAAEPAVAAPPAEPATQVEEIVEPKKKAGESAQPATQAAQPPAAPNAQITQPESTAPAEPSAQTAPTQKPTETQPPEAPAPLAETSEPAAAEPQPEPAKGPGPEKGAKKPATQKAGERTAGQGDRPPEQAPGATPPTLAPADQAAAAPDLKKPSEPAATEQTPAETLSQKPQEENPELVPQTEAGQPLEPQKKAAPDEGAPESGAPEAEAAGQAGASRSPGAIVRDITLARAKRNKTLEKQRDEIDKRIDELEGKKTKLRTSASVRVLRFFMPKLYAQVTGALSAGKNVASKGRIAQLEARIIPLKTAKTSLEVGKGAGSIIDAGRAVIEFIGVTSETVIIPFLAVILFPVLVIIMALVYSTVGGGTITSALDKLIKRIDEMLKPLEAELQREKRIIQLRNKKDELNAAIAQGGQAPTQPSAQPEQPANDTAQGAESKAA